MRSVALILLLAACGGAHPEPNAPPRNPDSDEQDAREAQHEREAGARKGRINVGSICIERVALQQAQCGDFGDDPQTYGQCVYAMGGKPNEAPQNPLDDQIGRCILSSNVCDHVKRCLSALRDPDLEHTRSCHDDDKVGLVVGESAGEYASRDGHTYHRASLVLSSREKPIERCGLNDGDAWVAHLACDNGATPLLDPDDPNANDARTALAGHPQRGGRCGSPVEHFAVKCPNQAPADLYVDAYVCPKP